MVIVRCNRFSAGCMHHGWRRGETHPLTRIIHWDGVSGGFFLYFFFDLISDLFYEIGRGVGTRGNAIQGIDNDTILYCIFATFPGAAGEREERGNATYLAGLGHCNAANYL